jgi:hypothetical protein
VPVGWTVHRVLPTSDTLYDLGMPLRYRNSLVAAARPVYSLLDRLFAPHDSYPAAGVGIAELWDGDVRQIKKVSGINYIHDLLSDGVNLYVTVIDDVHIVDSTYTAVAIRNPTGRERIRFVTSDGSAFGLLRDTVVGLAAGDIVRYGPAVSPGGDTLKVVGIAKHTNGPMIVARSETQPTELYQGVWSHGSWTMQQVRIAPADTILFDYFDDRPRDDGDMLFIANRCRAHGNVYTEPLCPSDQIMTLVGRLKKSGEHVTTSVDGLFERVIRGEDGRLYLVRRSYNPAIIRFGTASTPEVSILQFNVGAREPVPLDIMWVHIRRDGSVLAYARDGWLLQSRIFQ